METFEQHDIFNIFDEKRKTLTTTYEKAQLTTKEVLLEGSTNKLNESNDPRHTPAQSSKYFILVLPMCTLSIGIRHNMRNYF